MAISTTVLSDAHIDIFKEIASMGTAHAATALASMLSKKVTVSDLKVSWVDFHNVADFIGGPDNVIAGILISISGSMQGRVMHLMELESANTISNIMIGEILPYYNNLNEMHTSALKEFGNIMISSYVNSLAELISGKIKLSTPSLCIDMANALMSVPVAEYGKLADSALIIESKLSVEGENFSGCFSFVPNLESFKHMLHALGVG